MERRLVVAIALMIVVAVVPTLVFKPAPRPRPAADSTRVDSARAAGGAATPRAADTVGAAAVAPKQRPAVPAQTAAIPVHYDSVMLERPRAQLTFSTAGATIAHAIYPEYKTFLGRGRAADRPVDLVRPEDRLLVTRLIFEGDTIPFDSVRFTAAPHTSGVTFTGASDKFRETLALDADPARDYVYDVSGVIDGLAGRGGVLMVGLGTGFAQHEADSADNYRYYGVSVRRGTPKNTNFRDVPSDSVRTLDGPFDWVALKSKYFLAAVISPDSSQPNLSGVILKAAPRVGRNTATHVATWVTMPIGADGRFRYRLYLGPQEARALHAMGRDLERASPYGWAIFRPIIMPVATWVALLLRWMHENLHLAYGWVLVLFGVLVRLLLWPLNQKAMKSQVAMMAVQPLLKETQDRHKDDPQKQQQELMRIYREHKVNPLGGCLPMLLPWPVLIALFFAFSKAIELRGAPFLWLPDLAQRDPYYIIPLVMGASMYALSKLSQVGMPPNPQAKMMTVVMPVMMTVLFANFPSGLNLYYTVSNVISLPQQYFINKARMAEMKKRGTGGPAAGPKKS